MVVVQLCAVVVPPHVMRKHEFSVERIIMCNMNTTEMVQLFFLSIAAASSLFLLGNYGAEGDFGNPGERSFFWVVMLSGVSSFVVVILWRVWIIRGDMLADEAAPATPRATSCATESTTLLRGASNFWVAFGIFVCGIEIALVFIASARLDMFFSTLTTGLMPIVIISYCVSILCQPCKNDAKTKWFLRIYFVFAVLAGEAGWFWWAVKTNDRTSMVLHILRGLAWTGLQRGSMRLRTAVGGLPPEDLHKFLADTLFKGAAGTMVSVLFVSFRTTKCIFEGNFVDCSNTASSAGYVSLFLLLWWMQKLVQASIKVEWRQELSLTLEKLAHLEIGWRRRAQAALVAFTGMSGLFLFSTMDAKSSDYNLIRAVGLLGCICGFLSTSFEIFSVHRIKSKSAVSRKRSGGISASENDNNVEECSFVYIVVSFILSWLNIVLWAFYAVTLDSHWWMVANTIWALVVTSNILSFFMKPRRQDKFYVRFLHFHIFSFAVLSELANMVGSYRDGYTAAAISGFIRIPIWCELFRRANNLRRNVISKLGEAELSEFLCKTILGGGAAMAPMLFLSFEVLSCLASEGFDSRLCENSASATKFLSLNLISLTVKSILSKAAPKYVQLKLQLTYEDLAGMNLSVLQKVQGVLFSVAGVCSLYLFSVVGVEAPPDEFLYVCGQVGAVGVGLGVLIEARMVYAGLGEGGGRSDEERQVEEDPERRFSTSQLSDGLALGAVI